MRADRDRSSSHHRKHIDAVADLRIQPKLRRDKQQRRRLLFHPPAAPNDNCVSIGDRSVEKPGGPDSGTDNGTDSGSDKNDGDGMIQVFIIQVGDNGDEGIIIERTERDGIIVAPKRLGG